MNTLIAEAIAISRLGGEIQSGGCLGTYAIELAIAGWAVFPLRIGEKTPATRHGVLDATTDLSQVVEWWAAHDYNIGARVPQSLFVLDLDPRKLGAVEALSMLEKEHGKLPITLTARSGRNDGGKHFYFYHPSGKLSSKLLADGLDLKTSGGYCVMPPSIHPVTGQPYTWENHRAPALAPRWLVALLQPEQPISRPKPESQREYVGSSIADEYSANTSWADILVGWKCLDSDPNKDGARWRHPTATSFISATIRHGCLFVYSPNTPFEVTEASEPHGYTRFAAYAIMEHNGDQSVAARVLRGAL